MRWIVFLPLAVLAVLFALSNRETVQVRLWPFDLAWATPLSVAVLGIAGLAFLLGALTAWTAALPARRRGRQATRRAERLQAELDRLQARDRAAPVELAGPVP